MMRFRRFRLRVHPKKANEVEEDHDIQLKFGLTRYIFPPEDVSDLWKRIRQNSDPLRGKINKRSSWTWWYWIVAAVLLMAGTISLFLTLKSR